MKYSIVKIVFIIFINFQKKICANSNPQKVITENTSIKNSNENDLDKINKNSIPFSNKTMKELREIFKKFKEFFGKKYGNLKEENEKFSTFYKNLKKIDKENSELSKKFPKVKKVFGVNRFSDMSYTEFKKTHMNLVLKRGKNKGNLEKLLEKAKEKIQKIKMNNNSCINFLQIVKENNELRKNLKENKEKISYGDIINYNKLGYVTKVKNQQNCGGCWAFSAIANFETQFAIKYKEVKSFSEQQLIDCIKENSGCVSGQIDYAFDYGRNTGYETSSIYPFLGIQKTCRFDKNEIYGQIYDYASNYDLSEDSMLDIFDSFGPFSIMINADLLHNYAQGIISQQFSNSDCKDESINHSVIIVGYGIDEFQGYYWILKNSWGENFGENGYVRIAIGKNVMCVTKYSVFVDPY